MSDRLVKKGKISELTLLMKHIQVSKGAVTYKGTENNPNKPSNLRDKKNPYTTREFPKTTIEKALEAIEEKYKISKEDAIIIREICEEVSAIEEVQQKVSANKDNILFLQSYEPVVQHEVTTGYMNRELWDNLDDPIYTDKGGIFSIMSKTVIENIVLSRAA